MIWYFPSKLGNTLQIEINEKRPLIHLSGHFYHISHFLLIILVVIKFLKSN